MFEFNFSLSLSYYYDPLGNRIADRVFDVAIRVRLLAENGKVVYESLSARSNLSIGEVGFTWDF